MIVSNIASTNAPTATLLTSERTSPRHVGHESSVPSCRLVGNVVLSVPFDTNNYRDLLGLMHLPTPIYGFRFFTILEMHHH